MYYLSKNQASLYELYELPSITGIEILVVHFSSSRKALGSSTVAWLLASMGRLKHSI